MGAHNTGYTRSELADMTGVSRYTISYWTALGVLPPPVGVGRGVNRYYTQAHLNRIEEIKRLKDGNRTLVDMRDYFDPLEDEDDE